MCRKRKRQTTINPSPKQHHHHQQEDRLSNLPDSLLIEILNLLPIKSAVSTTTLSQRWRNLWTQLTSITIDYRHFQNSSNFHSIADAIISQLTSPFIRSFTLQLSNSLDLPPSTVVDSWFRKICSRNVQSILVNPERFSAGTLLFKLPTCIFQSKSLVHLHILSMFNCEFPDAEFSLPYLKILGLHCRRQRFRIVDKLIRACPILECMNLIGCLNLDEPNEVIIDITSYSLKTLFLSCYDYCGSTKFLINAPNLRRLFFNACSGSICSSATNLNALVSVRVTVSSETLALSLLKLFSSVQFLSIGHVMLSVLKSLRGERKDMKHLVFRNLEHLTLEFCDSTVDKLSWSPTDSVPGSLLKHVKHITIRLSKISNETHLLNIAKSLLSGARGLKEFNFCVSFDAGGGKLDEALRELKFCAEMFTCLHRCSSQCQIVFSGKYAKISADEVKIRKSDGRLVIWEELRAERMERNS